MNKCFFINGLYGDKQKAYQLFRLIRKEKPDFVFITGELSGEKVDLHQHTSSEEPDFISSFLFTELKNLRHTMECAFPDIMMVSNSGMETVHGKGLAKGEAIELWMNINQRCRVIGKYRFYGYTLFPDSASDKDNLMLLTSNDDLEFGIFLVNTVQAGDKILTTTDTKEPGRTLREFIDLKQPYIIMNHASDDQSKPGEWKLQQNRTWHFCLEDNPAILSVIKFNLYEPRLASKIVVQ